MLKIDQDIMKINNLKSFVGTSIFSITFTKKDGSLRKMTARLGVKSHLRGGTKKFSDEERDLITVFDMNNNGYRSFKTSNVINLKCNGITINFK